LPRKPERKDPGAVRSRSLGKTWGKKRVGCLRTALEKRSARKGKTGDPVEVSMREKSVHCFISEKRRKSRGRRKEKKKRCKGGGRGAKKLYGKKKIPAVNGRSTHSRSGKRKQKVKKKKQEGRRKLTGAIIGTGEKKKRECEFSPPQRIRKPAKGKDGEEAPASKPGRRETATKRREGRDSGENKETKRKAKNRYV